MLGLRKIKIGILLKLISYLKLYNDVHVRIIPKNLI